MTNHHSSQTDAWQHRNDDVNPGPLCGIVIHEPPKPSTKTHLRLNYTTIFLVSVFVAFPVVYWLHGCAQ